MSGRTLRYCCRAFMGHRIVLFDIMRTVTPWRKGSVFDVLRRRWADRLPTMTSLRSKVLAGSNWVLRGVVYSDILRKPKKAVVRAAHIMSLSWNSLDELKRFPLMVRRRDGVMGSLFGKEWERPWARLMPRSRRYNLS